MNIVQPVRFDPTMMLDDKALQYALKHRNDNGLKLTGNWKLDHFRDGQLLHAGDWEKNLFTTEGMNYLLDIIFGDTSKAASNIWYVGIFKNNVTPGASDTAAVCLGSSGTYGECQDPDDFDDASDGTTTASTGDKPGYTTASAASAVITNSAAQAQFTMNDGITVYGAFLSNVASCSTPGSAKLMNAKKFSAARSVVADDVLAVTVQITASSS